MKKIMVIGRVGCGKTTLCQRLFQKELQYQKTQSIELVGGTAIDTPGEYVENRAFYRALVVSGVEADVILLPVTIIISHGTEVNTQSGCTK